MSGYLQRIAASAIRQQPHVHPFVESIYAAGRRQEAPGFVSQAEAPSPGMPTPGSSSPGLPSSHPSASIPPSEPSGQSSAPGVEVPSHRGPRTPRVAGTAPSQPPAMPQPSNGELPVETNSSASQTFRPLLPLPGTRQQEAEMAHPARSPVPASAPAAPHSGASPSRAWAFQPILEQVVAGHVSSAPVPPDSPHPAAAKRDIPVLASRATPRLAAAPIAPTRRAAPTQAQDIQIHIGRIEVVAVPPPAPRMAPPPARKGLTLDEYLSRGNGRAR
jgi:hypothetical protein